MDSHFFFTDYVYNQDYMVVITQSHKAFVDLVKKELNIVLDVCPAAAGQFHGYECKKGRIGIIWVKDLEDTLVHEALHATSWCLQSRGILIDSQGAEESWAYYLTFLVGHIRGMALQIKKDKKKTRKVGKKNV